MTIKQCDKGEERRLVKCFLAALRLIQPDLEGITTTAPSPPPPKMQCRFEFLPPAAAAAASLQADQNGAGIFA
jgi:hypothetical protein